MIQVNNAKRRVLAKVAKHSVWCDFCRIRIAPYESICHKATKAYHERCYSKAVEAECKSQAA